MKLLSFIIFLLSVVLLQAQQPPSRVDSLRKVLNTGQGDKALTLRSLALAYWDERVNDSAMFYFNKSNEACSGLEYDSIKAKNFTNIGQIHYRPYGNLNEALDAFKKALPLHLEVSDSFHIANAYWDVGKILVDQGNFPEALTNLFLSLETFQNIQDMQGQAGVENSLGILYSKSEQFKKSIKYHRLAILHFSELGDLPSVALNYNNIGLSYKKMQNYDSALWYYQEGLTIARSEDFRMLEAVFYENMGSVRRELNQYDSAMSYHQQALEIANDIGYKVLKGWSYVGLADCYLHLGDLEKSIRLSTRGLKIAKNISELDLIRRAAEKLANAYAAGKNYKEAYKYHQIFKEYSDSLFNAEKVQKITALEYEFDHKKELELKELEAEKEREIYEASLVQQRNFRNAALVVVLFFAVFSFVLARNVKQKKKANKKLHDQNIQISEQSQKLSELNQLKDKLFAVVSHDLRGPMSIYQGFSFMVNTLLDEKRYDDLRTFSNELEKNSNKVEQLLDNLLTWAMAQQDGIALRPESVNIRACVEENLSLYEKVALTKKVNLKHDVDDHQQVWVDKNAFKTILRNLLNNALKFTESGSIMVTTEVSDQKVRIKVTDTGVGMPPQKVNHLFDFSNLESESGTRGEKGVGLGLRLVRDLVHMNNGSIQCQSTEGKGTTFTVSLPQEAG